MLKGGLIGFGRMGLTHFSILNSHPSVQFVGICDSSKLMLKNVKRFIGIPTFHDFREMLSQVDLDFVIISTPTATHADTIKEAINTGIHVFVEKPFALNIAQGKEILHLLEKSNIVNQVGYVLRSNDVIKSVKNLLDHEKIGSLKYFKMEMNSPTLLKESKTGWRSKKGQGGGCLSDFASHGIDLINHLVGVPTSVAGTTLESIFSKETEDLISSTLHYDNGCSGSLFVNWSDASFRKPSYKMELIGNEGKIIFDLHSFKIFFNNDPEVEGFSKGWNIRYVTDFVEPVRVYLRGYEFTRQLDNFIDSILCQAKKPLCTFKDGYNADLVIEKIRNDAGGN